MSIIINGGVIGNVYGNVSNVTIVNGRIVSGGGNADKKFDEKKSEDAKNIEKIRIDSVFANVSIKPSESSMIEAHLHGCVEDERKVKLEVCKTMSQLKIAVKIAEGSFIGNLKLDVTVPYKTFKEISIKTTSAEVTVNKQVSTESLKVETMSGSVETHATFKKVFIKTMNGDVDIFEDANQDVDVEVSTMSGDVSVEFDNINRISHHVKTMSGRVRDRRNCHTTKEMGYEAIVNVSTMSGDVTIR